MTNDSHTQTNKLFIITWVKERNHCLLTTLFTVQKFKILKFLLRVILPRQHSKLKNGSGLHSKLKNALHLHTKIKKENNDSHISPIVPERRPSQNKKGNYLGDRPHEIIFKQVNLETVELNKNFLIFIPNIFVLGTISI